MKSLMVDRQVTKEEVVAAFEAGGYTINERFRGCGFVYFPIGRPSTKENPDQGRVVFAMTGKGADTEISISTSWGRPTDQQTDEILKLLALYVTFQQQAAGK